MKRLFSAVTAALIILPAATSAFAAEARPFASSPVRTTTAGPKTAAAPSPAVYLVGADIQSINPTPAMIASKAFFLGGYGLSSGNIGNNLIPPFSLPGITNRPAIGLLGTNDNDGHGVHVRALAVGDGTHAIELAQIETQGYFNEYRQGPFGIEEIRKAAVSGILQHHPGAAITASQILVNSVHTHGGPDTVGAWGGVPTAYLQLVHDRTVAALIVAYDRMQPAHLQFSTAHAGVVGENDCNAQSALGMPCYPGDGNGDPLLTNQLANTSQNSGVDDEMRVLQARSVANNSVIVTYLNYSSHPTVLGSDNQYVTADYPGVVSDLLAAKYGGIGFDQVATLGRTQPNRSACANAALKGAALQRCTLDSYADRVFARAEFAIASAPSTGRTTTLTGKPSVGLNSYLLVDVSSNPLLNALMLGGSVGGAQLYRAINPPWFTGTEIGTDSFSGHIGNILISGGPGEMYPQIVETVRETVPAGGYLSVGTAGDFLGYIIEPIGAYPNVVLATIADGSDNLLFNDSQTLGERLTCSLLRGAGDTLEANPSIYWSTRKTCLAFATDRVLPAGYDTHFPNQPDLSSVITH